ncbi:MAG: hypothetical protein ACRETI_09120 [Steroidobacteraceae bacterium]
MSGLRMLLPLLVMALATTPARAAEEANAALEACRAEADDARRLACYDREMDAGEMDRIVREPESAGVSPAEAPAEASVPPQVLTAEERFGREGAMTREEVDRREVQSRELGKLEAKVTEIWTRSDGLMVFTLDNGQVWKQNGPDSQFRLKTGDPVRIQPAAMNSFLLSGPSKRSTRVSRLK